VLVGIGMILVALAVESLAASSGPLRSPLHSAANTTLGGSDIVMPPNWRLLGPQEAVSG
jgi:hypothetical protein